jgi:hypothetical protein
MLTVFGILLALVSFQAADVFGLSSSSVGGMLLGVTMIGMGVYFGKR